MKVALLFIISYHHILNKEQLWIDWIKPNQDIINLSDLFDFEKLKQFLSKYQTVFNEQLDFENIKQMQQSWVNQTESKSKNVF